MPFFVRKPVQRCRERERQRQRDERKKREERESPLTESEAVHINLEVILPLIQRAALRHERGLAIIARYPARQPELVHVIEPR